MTDVVAEAVPELLREVDSAALRDVLNVTECMLLKLCERDVSDVPVTVAVPESEFERL